MADFLESSLDHYMKDHDHNHEESITVHEDNDDHRSNNHNHNHNHNHNYNENEVHKVCMPPFVPTSEKLKKQLFEIFFADDPFSAFKNRTLYEKAVLSVRCLFHVFQWLPHYNFALFRSDLIAGITISTLAIPQGINYAELTNLPPILGLYSSFVPPLLYTVLGCSRHVAIGPTSTASLVMGTMLSEVLSYQTEPDLHLRLAFTATFCAGLFQASLGLFRLGFILDFLSKATLIGFMAGVAILVALQQMKGLMGITHFTTNMQLVSVISSVISTRNEWSGTIILMGVCILTFLLGARYFGLKKPKFFWISAAAPLISIVLSTILVFALQTHFKHFPRIGRQPGGINPPSAHMLYFHRDSHLALAVQTGLITGLLGLAEGIAVGRTFASMENYQLDGNKEMIALGAMNIASACCSCFITTASFSRSAVNYGAGAKTALSNAIMAVVVLITLLFLMPLFIHTPDVALAAIIIVAVIGLIDIKAIINLWKLDKLDFLTCFCTLFGVLFFSVQFGLAVAIGISIFKVILHVTRPNTVLLGNIPGTQLYQNLDRYKNTTRISSFLILGIESPIFFTNSNYLQDRILRWVRKEEDRIRRDNGLPLKCVILDMTAVTAIDTSGLDLITELKRNFGKKSLQFVLVNPVATVMEKLHRSDILELFEPKGLYLTVEEAVTDISLSREILP